MPINDRHKGMDLPGKAHKSHFSKNTKSKIRNSNLFKYNFYFKYRV